MLTFKHMIKASRQMRSYGELRPGYLEHQASNLSGPETLRPRPSQTTSDTANSGTVKLVTDTETGEQSYIVDLKD